MANELLFGAWPQVLTVQGTAYDQIAASVCACARSMLRWSHRGKFTRETLSADPPSALQGTDLPSLFTW
jgi:hypothetical protein